MISDQRGQARIIGAILACIIIGIAFSFILNRFSLSMSIQESGDLESEGDNLLNALSSSDIMQNVISGQTGWESELERVVENLLPPGTLFNLTLISGKTGEQLNDQPISNIEGGDLSEFVDVASAASSRIVTVSFVIFETTYIELDVMLIIDRSGSMEDPGNGETKMYYAKNASAGEGGFIDQLNQTRDWVGIVSYSYSSGSWWDTRWYALKDLTLQSWSDSYETVKSTINGLETGFLVYTNIGHAIHLATEELTREDLRPNAKKVMILLTDGIANVREDGRDCGEYGCSEAWNYAIDKANEAEENGITVYTIGFGEDSSYFNATLLEEMASEDGRYYHAAYGEELVDIYLAIAEEIKSEVITDTVLMTLILLRPG